MPRYIIIDNCSGYIFADSADLPAAKLEGSSLTPLKFVRAFDATQGVLGREYVATARLGANETGYRVYRADVRGSEAVPVAHDGQDQEAIDAVERDCELVITLRCEEADEAVRGPAA